MTEEETVREEPTLTASVGGAPLPVGRGDFVTPAGAAVASEVEQGPEGGEARTGRGLAVEIARVFVEHRLALASGDLIVLLVLFCFVGPVFYFTDSGNQQAVLATLANPPPGGGFAPPPACTASDERCRIM